MLFVEILFVVTMFLWIIMIFPGGPGAAYPWSGWIFAWLASLFLGIALFAGQMLR
jgi:hypothetical protein